MEPTDSRETLRKPPQKKFLIWHRPAEYVDYCKWNSSYLPYYRQTRLDWDWFRLRHYRYIRPILWHLNNKHLIVLVICVIDCNYHTKGSRAQSKVCLTGQYKQKMIVSTDFTQKLQLLWIMSEHFFSFSVVDCERNENIKYIPTIYCFGLCLWKQFIYLYYVICQVSLVVLLPYVLH